MHRFEYRDPRTLSEAETALRETAGAKLLAGGMSLVPVMRHRLARIPALIDLNRIEGLSRIEVSADAVTLGAMARHASVAASVEIKKALPALSVLAAGIGDRQVRNRGTLGGSLANNDPAADYPAAALGLGATIHTDKRTIAADDFFKGLYQTALNDGEVITAVSFPVPEKAGWQKFKQPASRFALVGVFVSKGKGGVRVAVTGAGPGVFRAKALEDKLAANWSGAACDGVKIDSKDLNSDLHGSAEYRAALIPVLAKRAVG